MTFNKTRVSNGFISNNPDFDVAQDIVAGDIFQRVKLTDPTEGSTSPIGNAANPMHVQAAALPLPAGAATEATLDSVKNLLSTIDAATTNIDSKVTACNTGAVTITNIPGGATSVVTQVAASASSVTLLAANADRKEAEFYNDSSYVCYLKKGTSAATNSYTAQVLPGGYYKINPGDYSGIVTGIWPVASGNMLVTEVSA